MQTTQDVNPSGLYSVTAAARLLPSSHAGKSLHHRTLRRWLNAGQVKGVKREVGGKVHWFIQGAELLKLVGFGEAPPDRGRSTAQAERDYEEAMAELRARGLHV